jgi:hypothetical protein
MKIKKKVSKNKSKKKRAKDGDLFGVNADLPEGIFGIIDDVSPLLNPETLHPTPWEAEAEKRQNKRRRERSRNRGVEAQIHIPGARINEDMYSDNVPDLEYENVVEVPEQLLKRVTRRSDKRTRDLSDLMLSRIMPSIMALEASQSYVTTALRDGLNIDVEMDSSMFEAIKSITNLDMLFFFLKKSSMPLKFRKQFMSTVVDEMAKNTVSDMQTAAKTKTREKAMAEMQSYITRGYSNHLRAEERRRSRTEPAPGMESPIGVVDEQPKSDIGSMRGHSMPRRRRSV